MFNKSTSHVIVAGMHGTGKTTAVRAALYHCIRQQLNILICCPTAFLALMYKSEFPTLECNTLHSAFFIPVDTTQPLRTNFALSEFQVVAIDEVSMISRANMLHVIETLNSLPVFPILLLCGDNGQLQPFEQHNQATATVDSFFDCHDLLARCSHFLFT